MAAEPVINSGFDIADFDRTNVCGHDRLTLAEYRPLKAGIIISTERKPEGTLGWFGKLGDGTVVLLTCKHVLYGPFDGIDNRKLKTAQPKLGCKCKFLCCECGNDHVIGKTVVGVKDIDVNPPADKPVDCAIATIDPGIAAHIVLRIANKSTTEVLHVKGTAVAAVGDKVRKIGARSGFTRGTVVHLGDLAVPAAKDSEDTDIFVKHHQIHILPDPTETYQVKDLGICKFSFSQVGDSGSVILNDDDKIIALLFGTDTTTNNVGVTYASPIQNVLDKLSANGSTLTLLTSPSGDSDNVSEGVFDRSEFEEPSDTVEPNAMDVIRDANEESLLSRLYQQHHREILELINHSRRVTIAWQRNQGPAYVAALARAAREEAYAVPYAINEISREDLLTRLCSVLLSHGSEVLKKDLERFGDDLISAAVSGESIQQFAENLRQAGFIDVVPGHQIPEFV